MKKLLLLFGLFTIFSVTALAQLGSKHYIPPMFKQAGNNVNSNYIYLSTPIVAPFNVTLSRGDGTILGVRTISQGNPAFFRLALTGNQSDVLISQGELHRVLNNKGLVLEGSEPFYASLRIQVINHAGYLTSKGESALSTSFRVGHNRVNNGGNYNFSTSVMATEDNTTVDVSDYDPGVVFNSGAGDVFDDNFSFRLDEGETFVISGRGDRTNSNSDGFIGALIESDKPIVINSGNLNANSDPAAASGSDLFIDQIVGIDALGTDTTNFIVIEGDGIPATERVMVLATVDGTDIFLNGNAVATTTINAGDYFLIANSEYMASGGAYRQMYVSTSKPSYLYQFLAGAAQTWTGGMNFIPPLSCFFQRGVDLIPAVDRTSELTSGRGYDGNIMIVAETGASITINGAPIGIAPQPVVGTTDWETYYLSNNAGNIAIGSDAPMAAGLYGASGSAGFAGYYSGFAVNPSDTELDICSNDAQVDLFPLINGNPPPDGVWTPALSGGAGVFVPGVDPPGVYNYATLSACAVVDVDITITVTSSPFAGVPNDLEFCDDDNDGFFEFDLTANEALILDTNAAANHAVSYHTSGPDAVSNTDPILTPAAFQNTVPTQQRIYARLEETGNTSCADTVSFLLEVFDDALIMTPADGLELCDTNNDGIAAFDLTVKETEILNGLTAADFTITYHNSQADADAGNAAIPTPTTYQNGTPYNETVFVRVENSEKSTCANTTSFTLEVFDDALIMTPADGLELCDTNNDGIAAFDLTVKETEILNGLTAADFTITYHNSQADADAGNAAIPTPTTYQNGTPYNETVFVRVENSEKSTCANTTSFTLEVFDDALIMTPADGLELCDTNNDGIAVFDLTVKETEILNGLTAADFTITYHNSQADADAGNAAIPTPTTYQNGTPYNETVFVRVENSEKSTCANTTSFTLEVFDDALIMTPADGLELCDTNNDGIAAFDLTVKETEILNGLTAADFTITYHNSQADADAGNAAIPTPTTYQNGTPYNETVFVRVENSEKSTCANTTSFTLEVFDDALIMTPADGLELCDTNNDGIAAFDLTVKETEILNGLTAADFTITYHNSQADADAGNAAIPTPTTYQNGTPYNETVFVRVENSEKSTCANTTSFTLEVFDDALIMTPADGLELCDTNNDGIAAFDLTVKETEILNGLTAADFTITYHNSQADADAGNAAIPTPTTYQNGTPYNETVFVRVENSGKSTCANTTSFTLEVFDTPDAVDVPIKVPTCSPTAMADFDLTLIINDVANNVPGMNVVFYETMALADAQMNPIVNIANYNSGTTTIFAVVSDPMQNNCSDIAEIDLEILLNPEEIPLPLAACATNTANTMGEFDLDSLVPSLINNAQGVTISFHETLADADAAVNGGLNAIANTAAYTSNSKVIFARSEADYNNGNICHTVSEITLTLNPRPEANNINYPICTAAATADFDLDSRIPMITGGANPRDVRFFATMVEAIANDVATVLPSPFNSGTTTVFARVENTNTACVSFAEVSLEVIERPIVTGPFSLTECLKMGVATFDLAAYRTGLQATYPNYTFTFHETLVDATAGNFAVPDSYSSAAKDLVMRVEVTGAGTPCFETATLQLNIEIVPVTQVEAIFCAGSGYTLPDGTLTNMPGEYSTTLQDNITGCDYIIETTLTLGEVGFVSAFTPNGNGENDLFGALPSQECAGFVADYHLQVWNRWGEKVFETKDYGAGWDGTFNGYQAPAGVYVYVVEYTFQDEDFENKGSVTLIR